MDASLAYFYDGQSKYVDHKIVETMSREVSKIITEQIRHKSLLKPIRQSRNQAAKSKMG